MIFAEANPALLATMILLWLTGLALKNSSIAVTLRGPGFLPAARMHFALAPQGFWGRRKGQS